MSPQKEFHHYTTLDTLALILKSRKIRFNRLDLVDDVKEANKYGNYHLSRLLFASCWTDTEEENIPLWDRYSKMRGVKISLPADPFEYRPLGPHPTWGGIVQGEIMSILPIEEIFTNEYMVNPNFTSNKELFIRKVEYIDEQELKKIREQAVQQVLVDGNPFYQMQGPQNLAGYKTKEWAFQQEIRYILMVYPTPPIPPAGISDPAWVDEVPKFLLKSISEGTGPNKSFFDIAIDQNYFNNIKVTLAPRASAGDKIIVESLLQKYTKNGVLFESRLTNSIR